MFHVEHFKFMKDKSIFLNVKDHSVSGENFQLIHNSEYDYLETLPQPKEDKLSEYYKSEDYISHTNSKRNLFEKAYHLVRSVSLKRKLKLINSFSFSEKKILDIGCGTGDFLKTAKKNGWDIIGIEPNEQARLVANQNTNNSIYNSEKLKAFEPHHFDVITLWHVLEHLPKLEEHLKLFQSLLKPDGVLIIAVPNYKSYDATYYKSNWAAYDVPRHLWHFSKTSLFKLASKHNMRVTKTFPMLFDSYYVSLLSEKYKSGKMNILNAIRIGMFSNLKAKRSGEYSSLIYVIKNK